MPINTPNNFSGGKGGPGGGKGKKMRLNHEIRNVKEVRLISESGEMVGVVPIEKAMTMARQAELDLCEISPTAKPPVCRIMDFGKYVYQQKKKEHENVRKHQAHEQKQLRLRSFRIDKHDLEIKVKQTRFFIESGNRVLFTLQFRARENDRPELGRELLMQIFKAVEDVAVITAQPVKEGKRMTMLISPVPNLEKILAKRKAERERLAKEQGVAALPEEEALPEELLEGDEGEDDVDDDDAEDEGGEDAAAPGGADDDGGAAPAGEGAPEA